MINFWREPSADCQRISKEALVGGTCVETEECWDTRVVVFPGAGLLVGDSTSPKPVFTQPPHTQKASLKKINL